MSTIPETSGFQGKGATWSSIVMVPNLSTTVLCCAHSDKASPTTPAKPLSSGPSAPSTSLNPLASQHSSLSIYEHCLHSLFLHPSISFNSRWTHSSSFSLMGWVFSSQFHLWALPYLPDLLIFQCPKAISMVFFSSLSKLIHLVIDHLKAWLMPRGLYAAELEGVEKPPQCAGFDFQVGHLCSTMPAAWLPLRFTRRVTVTAAFSAR